ncbi:cleavage stimulation factor subunit 3 [Geosmithia morbida]|uniref:mRNA 3'-end-processing protein RNA14 n=1 Tax=Geosmithia morbida TaxID=1094350 RepID=A0A9P4Z0V0_9HYPO|nr:cleavage stimulation factor subunit 3 [Geosmithia morbida]KAF4126057.1 cleavage stimulation factor subunit 3 [Geosmithia morbida]
MASEDVTWEGQGYNGTDNQQREQQQQQVDNITQDSHISADAEEEEEEEESVQDDGADYDPESVSFDPPFQVPDPDPAPASSAPAPAVAPGADARTKTQSQRPKPKMSGGFVVEASDDEEEDDDDDDDEEEDDDDGGDDDGDGDDGNGNGNANTPQTDAAVAAVAATENNGTSVPTRSQNQTAQAQPQQQQQHGIPVASRSVSVMPAPAPAPEARIPEPHVPVGIPTVAGLDPTVILEARIKEDPRGDMDAWLGLMADHRRRSSVDALRSVYNRFLEVFPQAVKSTPADIWVEWIDMELGLDQFAAAEQLFGRCLMAAPNVRLWTVYLNYIRRRNDLTNDASGQARRTVAQSYEFVIDNIGVDRDSGPIWQDYIHFIKSGPGQIGGAGWQDQQKMDQLRKAYHRAITVPMSAVNNLWKEYDQFEMGLNKLTGRKFIQERSPGYMSAKSANIALDNITRGLKRTNLPRLAPAPGFDGDAEFREQVDIWKRWIAWEKEDPLVLAADEPKVFRQRVMYCYRQALMALRFWPEIWVDAAEWCFGNQVRDPGSNAERDAGTDMLVQGLLANPESVLLALKHADHVEANYPAKEGDIAEYAKAVRKPLNDVLDTLYRMGDKVKEREKLEISTIRQAAASTRPSIEQDGDYDGDDDDNNGGGGGEGDDDDDDDDNDDGDGYVGGGNRASAEATESRIQAIQRGYAAESQVLSRTISHVWIAMARAMRRIQGKGNQTDGGLRSVFTEARHRGRLTSDVYVAVALLESVVYKDPVGAKIFERGARLFPNDEGFMVEYLRFLHSRDDTTNARVVFETCVNRLVSKPETLHKAKPLYAYFHKYECQFGELSQISKLEDRMAELFPEDPRLSYFTARYSTEKFDPVAVPIIISKAVQMRPKLAGAPATDQQHQQHQQPKQHQQQKQQPVSGRDSPLPPPTMPPIPHANNARQQSPRPQYVSARATASPKRPLGAVEDEELNPPKRLARGASPLKGAAGRRLDQQRRNQASALHRDISFLLTILPPAHTYDSQRLNAAGLTNLLRETTLPESAVWNAKLGQQQHQQHHQHQHQHQQNSRQTTPGAAAAAAAAAAGGGGGHGRQPSADFAGGSGSSRPISPYGRLQSASGTGYRNSPLGYAPPPGPDAGAGGGWPAPAGGYGAPPSQGQYGYRY